MSKECINLQKVPIHVAIIMDGNGRWAMQRGNQRIFGHQNGVNAVREAVEAAGEIGVKYLTLYAFSTENWNRPKAEVDALMDLLVSTINGEVDNLSKNRVRLSIIGDIESLPKKARLNVAQAIEKTANNDGLNLILALSYSARWEIVDATKKIVEDVVSGKLPAGNISQELFSNYLTTKGIPDPELLIRTSGEERLSNFLLWQLAYAEFYFSEVLWPDFDKNEFFNAVLDFQRRERRFGKTGDQIKHKC
ncbi:MAG TPA: isoprenyl transferase [Williamwhitmania sp.]|nr:isoprenyl transferase [Williamwhitmania sp.]